MRYKKGSEYPPNDSNEDDTDSDNGDGAKNDEDSDGPHDQAKDASDSNPKHLKSALKPCDYFDLICGTSTGGLIALMLGRLEYTVDEAITQYEELAKEIFGKKLPWLTRWDAIYDHNILEDCLKRVIQGSPLEPKLTGEEPLKDESRRCRTFVLSTELDEHSSEPAILRSYDVRSIQPKTAPDCKIWEAGRATSAAPTFFKPIVINHDQTSGSYSDGATRANNPTHFGIMEAIKIWNPANIDCIVSLGTDPERGHTMDNATLELLGPWGMWLCQKMLFRYYYYRIQLASYSLQAMTGTDEPHQKTKQMVQAFRGDKRLQAASDAVELDEVYFRLNVTDPEALVDLDTWRQMPKLQQLADQYMKTDRVAIQSKEGIVARLAGSRSLEPLSPNHLLDTSPFQLDLTIYEYKSDGSLRAKGMIDTATQANLISKRLVQLLKYPVSALRSLRDLTKVYSTVQADFRIRDGKIMRISFAVVDTEVFDVILGSESIISEGLLMPLFREN